jgi:PKD repeat protein
MIDWGDGTAPEPGIVSPDKTVSGDHVYADDGTYMVTVTVVDDDGDDGSDTFTVTVQNVAPVVEAGLDQMVDEGTAVSLGPATFTDPGPGDAHTATIDWGDGTAPEPGIVSPDKTVSGDHVYADDGSYTVTVTVTDDSDASGSDTLTVTVQNVAPAVDAGPDQWVDEGMVVSLSPATFNDLGTLDLHTATIDWGDGTPVEIGNVQASPYGPPGSTTGVDGTVAGDHVYADNGTYTVTVTVTDDDLASTADTFMLTVENVVPVVNAGVDQVVSEGDILSLDPAVFNDLGTLDTHTATIDWGDGSPLEAGIVRETPSGPPGSTDGAWGMVLGDHVYADNGTYAVAVIVTDDDGASGADTFEVVVQNVAPAVDAGADQTVYKRDTLSFTVSFNDPGSDTHTATINWGDGSPVEYLVDIGSPFSRSHVYANAGIFTVSVTVTDDDGATGSDTAVVTVLNRPPIADDLGITTSEDTLVSITLTGSDPDGDPLTYSIVSGPLHGTMSGAEPYLSYTPNPNSNGPDSFTFKVNDGAVDSNVATVSIIVNPVNDPPSLSGILDVDFDEDDSDSSLDLDSCYSDVETPAASAAFTCSGNTHIQVDIDPASHVVTFTADPNWHGQETITFTATDSGDDGESPLSASDDILVTVNPVNDPPELSGIPDVSFDEDSSDSSLDLDDYCSDVETLAADVAFVCSGNTHIQVDIDPASHVVTFTADPDWNGQETITFTATDTGDDGESPLSDSDSIVVTVKPVNDPPVAIAGPDQVVERNSVEGALMQLNGSASYDIDSETLTYEWSWSGGTASGMNPMVVLPMGSTTVTLTVFDDGRPSLSDTDTVDILVEDTTAPEVNILVPNGGPALQDGVTFEAEVIDFSVITHVYFYIREPGGPNGIPIGYENLPATFNSGTGNWEYEFDTTLLQDGYYVILASAKDSYDNEGWSETVPFSIRNWAIVELLPATERNKAGRTMPVKFSLRIAASVDPAQPFVYNEGLEIRIYDTANSNKILQTSHFGSTSKDYRINTLNKLYITNFKTTKKLAEYMVEIWRISKNWKIGEFTFETVK